MVSTKLLMVQQIYYLFFEIELLKAFKELT